MARTLKPGAVVHEAEILALWREAWVRSRCWAAVLLCAAASALAVSAPPHMAGQYRRQHWQVQWQVQCSQQGPNELAHAAPLS